MLDDSEGRWQGRGGAPSSDSGSLTPSPLHISTFILRCHQHQLHSHRRDRLGWEQGRRRVCARHQKGCLELYQGKETGRTETASGTAHLFNKCSLSWAVSALSQRKFKCFGNLGGISGWTDSWSRAGTFPRLQTVPVPHRNCSPTPRSPGHSMKILCFNIPMLSVPTKVWHHALPGQKLISSLKPVLWGPKD